MALLKAFVCQAVLFGLYKLFLEQVVGDHLVPDELTRNCLVGFVFLLCFGIQLYTEKVEEQAESSKAKSRRRMPTDTAERVSEFLDERTVHMMRTLDAAMQHVNQMPVSDGYVQNVIFTAAGPGAAVIEQTFSKQPDGVVIEEIYTTKPNDVMNTNERSEVPENETIVVLQKVAEAREEKQNDKTESEEEEEVEEEEEIEEEIETKSDVCEEEEDDVVTVIDASKPKPQSEAAESEEEEEEEEEKEEKVSSTVGNRKILKTEEKPVIKQSKDDEEEEEEEEESEEEEVVKKRKT